jgi:hypothetical protein
MHLRLGFLTSCHTTLSSFLNKKKWEDELRSAANELRSAARTGNLAEAQKWVARGVDVNARDYYRETPLHGA